MEDSDSGLHWPGLSTEGGLVLDDTSLRSTTTQNNVSSRLSTPPAKVDCHLSHRVSALRHADIIAVMDEDDLSNWEHMSSC